MTNTGLFNNKTLLITGGTGSFGNAVLNRFLRTDIVRGLFAVIYRGVASFLNRRPVLIPNAHPADLLAKVCGVCIF